MLHHRGLDTVCISKVKGHADKGMVLHGRVREEDKLGNDAADEAAGHGRCRVSPAVIDARRNLSGVCGRWYLVILDLHRFFIAIARAVVNHDGLGGTALDPLVWSAGALHKRRRLVHAVRDRAFLPGPPGIWHSDWFQVSAAAICAEDISLWPYTPGLLFKWVSFLNSLHTSALDIEEVLSGATDFHVHLFVADVVKSFDTVDRTILDCVLSRLGLPGWFRHAYFEYHAHVRLRFKLASGLGQPWTRNGGIPQGCPLSMMFIVALYLPWCRYLSAQVGVRSQLYADNLKCLSGNPDLLMHAARFTTGYVRVVGQEPALSKFVLLSTSRVVGKDMEDWVLSQDGDRWSV